MHTSGMFPRVFVPLEEITHQCPVLRTGCDFKNTLDPCIPDTKLAFPLNVVLHGILYMIYILLHQLLGWCFPGYPNASLCQGKWQYLMTLGCLHFFDWNLLGTILWGKGEFPDFFSVGWGGGEGIKARNMFLVEITGIVKLIEYLKLSV